MTQPQSAIVDFTSLKAAAADYLIRDDLVTQIPLFVQFATSEFNRKIRNRQMEVREYTTTVQGQDYYALPADYVALRKVAILGDPSYPVVFKTAEQQDFLYRSNSQYRPQSYSIFGQEMRLRPVPESNYTLELFYYQKIPVLGGLDSNNQLITTNWLINDHPDLMLYATLMQAQPYLLDDTRFQVWGSIYGSIMGSLEEEERGEEWNGPPLTPNVDVFCP